MGNEASIETDPQRHRVYQMGNMRTIDVNQYVHEVRRYLCTPGLEPGRVAARPSRVAEDESVGPNHQTTASSRGDPSWVQFPVAAPTV